MFAGQKVQCFISPENLSLKGFSISTSASLEWRFSSCSCRCVSPGRPKTLQTHQNLQMAVLIHHQRGISRVLCHPKLTLRVRERLGECKRGSNKTQTVIHTFSLYLSHPGARCWAYWRWHSPLCVCVRVVGGGKDSDHDFQYIVLIPCVY